MMVISQTATLKGRVVAPHKDVVGVSVQNTSQQTATITDVEGNFSIRVSVGDTLLFSAVQLKNRTLLVTAQILKSPFIQVPMETFVNQLDEVTVRPFNLSGDITKDIVGLPLEKDVSATALGLPNAGVKVISKNENKLHDADHGKFANYYGIALTINLNKILNRLSGRTKRLKTKVAQEAQYGLVKAIEEQYADSLLLATLKIDKSHLHDFLRFCEADETFTNHMVAQNELKILAFLMDKSDAYRKNMGLE